jgi:hypothetical protein
MQNHNFIIRYILPIRQFTIHILQKYCRIILRRGRRTGDAADLVKGQAEELFTALLNIFPPGRCLARTNFRGRNPARGSRPPLPS